MLVPPHPPLHLVLVSPQIPPNTGNVARLCAVTGSRLILIDPLGFSIEDKQLKRAGLDYWQHVFLARYGSYEEYVNAYPDVPRALFSARAERSIYQAHFRAGHHLVFGSETQGLAETITQGGSGELLTIPMLPDRRSLNLSTAVGIAAYEAIRQLSGSGG